MTVWMGWFLAIAALGVGWQAYGWQGVLLAVSIIVFWLLLQFSRTMRVMRKAAERPMGDVSSAVMMNAKLHAGIPLLDVIRMTGSLGRRTAETPETYAWADAGGAEVEVVFENGRVARWTFSRPQEPADPAS